MYHVVVVCPLVPPVHLWDYLECDGLHVFLSKVAHILLHVLHGGIDWDDLPIHRDLGYLAHPLLCGVIQKPFRLRICGIQVQWGFQLDLPTLSKLHAVVVVSKDVGYGHVPIPLDVGYGWINAIAPHGGIHPIKGVYPEVAFAPLHCEVGVC